MRSSDRRGGITRRILVATAVAALLFAGVGTAGADGRRPDGRRPANEAFLEAKDAAKMTLTLEDDVVVRVTEETRIYDADQKRISFERIPDPTQAQVTVEYDGTPAGKGEILARKLVVRMTPR
jgi:hypothetical protein